MQLLLNSLAVGLTVVLVWVGLRTHGREIRRAALPNIDLATYLDFRSHYYLGTGSTVYFAIIALSAMAAVLIVRAANLPVLLFILLGWAIIQLVLQGVQSLRRSSIVSQLVREWADYRDDVTWEAVVRSDALSEHVGTSCLDGRRTVLAIRRAGRNYSLFVVTSTRYEEVTGLSAWTVKRIHTYLQNKTKD